MVQLGALLGRRPLLTRRPPLPIVLGALATLLLLLAHARVYEFLTDDAFISFRYARNLSEGYGLVFNQGHERVEGYSNLLWVLILAAFDHLGIPPESAANGLSLLASIVLWGIVVRFAFRASAEDPGRKWIALLPALLLAATRSVAIWSTSGLETRLFEVLVAGGALRLVSEVESQADGKATHRPLAGWFFALAVLTRPDGILVAATSFGTAAAYLAIRRRLDVGPFMLQLLPVLALFGGHLAFRLAYYGDWLPNTYYAKVGGELNWEFGLRYHTAWILEYAAYLWVPLLIAGVLYHRRRGSTFIPMLFGGLVVPHALYVAAIGGDHFEYRPIDLYFPFCFLLLADGVRHLLRRPAATWATAAYLCLVLIGLIELPYQSHRQAPDRHMAGFPGLKTSGGEEFMRPERDPVYRWPGLSRIASVHRRVLDSLTCYFVALRQEEHRHFLDKVVPEGRRLRQLVDRGLLPGDTFIAVSSVGAIPYYSGLRTLDRVGLTDADIARSEFRSRLMAHGKHATPLEARDKGVDFWALDAVHSLWHVSHPLLFPLLQRAARNELPVFAADVGDGYYLIGMLPQGQAHASRRFPSLAFCSILDAEFMSMMARRAANAHRNTLRLEPDNRQARQALERIEQLLEAQEQAPRE
jgi:arabinofuranosyltransferase